MVNKFMEMLEFREGQTAQSTDMATQEITCEYDVLEDIVDTIGVRTIKLKQSSRDTIVKRKRIEVCDAILKGLGEKDSKAFAELLQNAINEHGYDVVEEFHRRVVKDKQTVKVRKECFQVVIGKRLSGSSIIALRS